MEAKNIMHPPLTCEWQSHLLSRNESSALPSKEISYTVSPCICFWCIGESFHVLRACLGLIVLAEGHGFVPQLPLISICSYLAECMMLHNVQPLGWEVHVRIEWNGRQWLTETLQLYIHWSIYSSSHHNKQRASAFEKHIEAQLSLDNIHLACQSKYSRLDHWLDTCYQTCQTRLWWSFVQTLVLLWLLS